MSNAIKAFITVVAGLAGFCVFYFPRISLKADYGAYLSIAALAGLDAVIGGARAVQEGKFKSNVFLSGFLATGVLAVLLTWFGERIGVNIGLAAVFVFVYRIMQNLSIIRTHWLEHETIHMPHLRSWPGARRPAPDPHDPAATRDVESGSAAKV